MGMSPLERMRLILYHQQATSARTLFLRIGSTVCTLGHISEQAQVLKTRPQVLIHPATLLKEVKQQLGIAAGDLEINGEFQEWLFIPESTEELVIFLAHFTSVDAPHGIVQKFGGRFIALTEARDLPPVELNLLRQAYAVIMG